MTYEELTQLPFKFHSHMSMEHEHATVYVCEKPGYMIAYCDHVPYKDGEPKGRSFRHWMVNGVICLSKKSLIKEIENL